MPQFEVYRTNLNANMEGAPKCVNIEEQIWFKIEASLWFLSFVFLFFFSVGHIMKNILLGWLWIAKKSIGIGNTAIM